MATVAHRWRDMQDGPCFVSFALGSTFVSLFGLEVCLSVTGKETESG